MTESQASDLPPGLLPGCTLLLRRLEVVPSQKGSLYAKLTSASRVTAYRCAAHNFDDFDEAATGTGTSTAADVLAAGCAPVAPGSASRAGGGAMSAGGSRVAAAILASGGRGGSRLGAGMPATASGIADGAAAIDSPRLSQAAVLTRSTPTLLCELTPHGPPIQGLLRLLLTVKQVYDISLLLRCCTCGDVRVGSSCRCPHGNASSRAQQHGCGSGGHVANLEVEIKVDVTDGTGRAYLLAKGKAMWALLQCSQGKIDRLRSAVEASGPLSCRALPGSATVRECLSLGRGQWQCGSGLNISDAHRTALDGVWPSHAHWQRECVVHCRPPLRPHTPTVREASITIAKTATKVLQPETRFFTLVASELAPLAACDMPGEVERTLGPGGDALF